MKDHTRPRTAHANARDTSPREVRRVVVRAGTDVLQSNEHALKSSTWGGQPCSF